MIPEREHSQMQVQNHPEPSYLLGDYPPRPCDFITEASPRPLWWEGGPGAGVRLAGEGFTSSLISPTCALQSTPSHICVLAQLCLPLRDQLKSPL